MPLGWECRKQLVKQVPLRPTEKRPTKWDGFVDPGPDRYEPPPLLGGDGYSKIRRAPQYSFGIRLLPIFKSATLKAQLHNIRGYNAKGRDQGPQITIGPKCEMPGDKTIVPGPGAHEPNMMAQKKCPPKYSLRIAAKPPYQSHGMWTPSPNMYCPPINKMKRAPAYSLYDKKPHSFDNKIPGPGTYSPRPHCASKTPPAFSILGPHNIPKPPKSPAPNAYCEKRFIAVKKPAAPAPSFGIKHSQYIGQHPDYLLPPDIKQLKKKD